MSKQINEFEKAYAKAQNEQPKDPKTLWQEIENFLFVKDKNGEWERGKNGKRVLAWTRILLQIWQLIALLVQRIDQHEAEQQGRGEITPTKPDEVKKPVTVPISQTPDATPTSPDETKRSIEQEPAPDKPQPIQEPQPKIKKKNT